MHKLENISVGKSDSGNKCSVCHSSNISFVYTLSTEDAFFLLIKLFEAPADQCVKSLKRQHSGPGPSVEKEFTSGLQLQLCSSCEIEIERAKQIYEKLVVAVGQFRDIQKKLARFIKSRCGGQTGTGVSEFENTADDYGWSLSGTNIIIGNAGYLENFEKRAPFMVEDLRVKYQLTTGTLLLTHHKLLEFTEGDQNVSASFPPGDQSLLMEHDAQVKKYLTENTVASEASFHTESYGNIADEDDILGKGLEDAVGTEKEQSEHVTASDHNSPTTTVKEEYVAWVDDEAEVENTGEENSEDHTFLSEADKSEHVIENLSFSTLRRDNGSSKSVKEPCNSAARVVKKNNYKDREQPSLQCSKCDMYYSTEGGLRKHMSQKHKIHGSGFNREKCQRITKKRKHFSTTPEKETVGKFRSNPLKAGKFNCPEEGCEKSFRRPFQLKIHLSRHAKQPMYKCEQCEKAFYTKPMLRSHIQKKHPEVNLPKPEKVRTVIRAPKMESYECHLCSKVFKTNAGFITHNNKIHGILEPMKERMCPEQGCGIIFKTENSLMNLRDHLSRCHGWEPTHKCSKCDKTFNTWKQKWRHEQKVHEGGLTTRPFVCDLCGKGFACADYLHSHKYNNHKKLNVTENNGTDSTRRYICDLCGASLSSAPGLHSHKRMQHEGKGPVTCDICGNTFKHSFGLKKHILLIHEKEKLKIACPLCDSKFANAIRMADHMYHYHPEESEKCTSETSKIKVFQCPITGCRRYFHNDRSKLDDHMIEIHGEDGKKLGVFICKYCGRRFFLIAKWRGHETRHENEKTKPYICDICHKGFSSPYYLQFHKKNTHKIKDAKVEHGAKRKDMSANV